MAEDAGWTDLGAPPSGVRGEARMAVNQKGGALLVLPAWLAAQAFPATKNLRVSWRVDGDETLLRLSDGPKGERPLKQAAKNGRFVQFEAPPHVPPGSRWESCQVVDQQPGCVVLRLPRVWHPRATMRRAPAQNAAPPPGPPAPSAAVSHRPAPPPAAKGAETSSFLNGGKVVAYLGKKGHAAKRHGDGFLIDGEATTRQDALKLVNSYRGRATLPQLTLADLA